MKFGKNLIHLSVPEWRDYNIDYNDLKHQIKELKDKPANISLLYGSFISNFDYINLFISSKQHEIDVKLNNAYMDYHKCADLHGSVRLSKMDEIHFHILIDLSIELKKLNKFILIQKIAIKKIFKKFIKYSDIKDATSFVNQLQNYLLKNRRSVYNIDLGYLTNKLTNLVNLINNESETNSVKSIYSTTSSYELTHLLKKNFKIDFLIPNDSNTTNELLINLNLHINLTPINQSKISFIYLTNRDVADKPSYILTDSLLNESLVVAHTGGLRDYSYCILHNDIIKNFLHYLNGDIELESTLKLQLDGHLSSLAKLTIDTIINDQLKPSLQIICQRNRYIVDSNEDDYLVCFDQDIYTTDLPNLNLELNTDKFDIFPFNHLIISSNDSNLHNFESNLITQINDDNSLKIQFNSCYLTKLPLKVQQLIKNKFSLNLFKNLSFFEYLKSCYFNQLPNYYSNHFQILLNLNLMKNLENVIIMNEVDELDANILQSNSNFSSFRKPSSNELSPLISKKEPEIEYETDDNYMLFLNLNNVNDQSLLNQFIFNCIKFKTKISNYSNIILHEKNFLYDSINDDPYEDFTNDYQIQFEIDYDNTLSFFYFSLLLISLFIVGIDGGIIYSLKVLNSINENSLIVFVLIMGLLTSLIFSSFSILISLKRFNQLPVSHSLVLGSGTLSVIVCVAWGVYTMV